MDKADYGRANDEFFLKVAMKNRKPNSNDTRVTDHCMDCGRLIPEPRRQAARAAGITCRRCIDCQTRYERNPHGAD
jgi:RNA polymerase-binding transcription factor DksA